MNNHQPNQNSQVAPSNDPWMIDTVAISGGSKSPGGLNGDQYFSHMIEEYSEPKNSAAVGVMWLVLFIIAFAAIGWVGMQKLGGLEALQSMLSSSSQSAIIAQKVKKQKAKRVKAKVPTMKVELITPGTYAAEQALTKSVQNTPDGQLTPIPKPTAIKSIVQVPAPPIARGLTKQNAPLVQIDRVQITARPDVGFDDISLPVGVQKPNPGTLRTISSSTRSELEGMLSHRFTYKQYAAMERLRRLRLAGSEDLLRQGLSHRKFWTRMEALFGLAEIGAQLSPADLQAAIGTARPYLQKSYFKRFKRGLLGGGLFYQGPNLAEKYILSLCMYFVNEQAQTVISQAIRS